MNYQDGGAKGYHSASGFTTFVFLLCFYLELISSVKAVIRFWMQLKFLTLGEPLLWFSCLFISVYFSFITCLNNLVFILCLLRLQIQFKTMGVFDSRVEFIFHTHYCVK